MTLTYYNHDAAILYEQDSSYYTNPSLGTVYSFYPDSSWVTKYTGSQLEGDVSIRYGTQTLELWTIYSVERGYFL